MSRIAPKDLYPQAIEVRRHLPRSKVRCASCYTILFRDELAEHLRTNERCRKMRELGFSVIREPLPIAPLELPSKAPVSIDEAQDFYRSYAWRQIRYCALKAANGRCEACGRRPNNNLYLVVDHIFPLRHYWHLRLDGNNLQVLCSECNAGKSNWDRTDWKRVSRTRK